MTAGNYRGKHYTDCVDKVKDLKREDRLDEALTLLNGLVKAVENEAKAEGRGVAPWYYEQVAIICRKRGDLPGELAILQRYDQQRAAPGASPSKMAARLRKVNELVAAAEAADAPPACPGCGVVLPQKPAKSVTCPECGVGIVVRKRAGQTQMFTLEQAAELKALDAAAREREKALLLAGRIGFDETAFDAQAADLTARFGSPALLGDVYWALSNRRVIELSKDDDTFGLSSVYYEQAQFLHGEGRDWTQAAALRVQSTLKSLSRYPELVFMRCPCPPCQTLPWRTYTPDELEASMPVPHLNCQKPPCVCAPSPKRDADGGLTVTYEIDLDRAAPRTEKKPSLFKRLFG
jgi:predicted RNA-binding Zn-ribbon protein involved in translation (DUF1610 family)